MPQNSLNNKKKYNIKNLKEEAEKIMEAGKEHGLVNASIKN